MSYIQAELWHYENIPSSVTKLSEGPPSYIHRERKKEESYPYAGQALSTELSEIMGQIKLLQRRINRKQSTETPG